MMSDNNNNNNDNDNDNNKNRHVTKLHAIPHFPAGSLGVYFRDHLQFRIISGLSGLGIICGWGSFAVLYGPILFGSIAFQS